MDSGFNTILCRYCEIALKGKNRGMFEQCLMNNIRYLLKQIENLKISRIRGRISLSLQNMRNFSHDEMLEIKTQLTKAFGLASFSPANVCDPEMNSILKAVETCSGDLFANALKRIKNPSFRIRARRADKSFPLVSRDIEITIAELVDKLYNSEERLRVDLENADITVSCEVREKQAFIFLETIRGPGGLPTGSNAPVLCLVSGGIDSPVAAALMMKRGCHVDFITFDSFPYTSPEALEKVRRITKVLNSFQTPGKLFMCNLAEIQKKIRDNCSEKYRTILYRRYMFRIAQEIALKNKNKALITGEAVGQVASQTIVNLGTINNATDMLVLRPLGGMDKEEVIVIAKKINTFDISKLQVPDSCTVFAPNAPATAAPLHKIQKEEDNLDIAELLEETLVQTLDSMEIISS